MNIYLLTFHGSVNYGAVLQAYALSKTLCTMGCTCKVIDYNREAHHANFLQLTGKSWKGMAYQLLQLPDKYILHKKFNAFTLRNMPLTDKSYNGPGALQTDDFEKDAFFLVGSDQVWNCELTDNNMHYFLDFTDSPHKYSYAASFGVADISNWRNRDTVLQLMRQFSRVSVREESGREIARRELGIDAQVVCDPTFLLNGDDWQKVAVYREKVHSGYILLFLLTYNEALVRAAEKLAEEKHIPIINIAYTVRNVPGARNVKNVSPDEWLGYITRAEYVFTNSFHGFALSLNNHRQVWVALTPGSRNSRILDIAKRYGVEHRIIDSETADTAQIEYFAVEERIHEDRIRSLGYLKEILNDNQHRESHK